MLQQHGCIDISVSVVQPMGLSGDVKLILAETAESISEAVVGAGLASAEDVEPTLAQELYAEAANPATLSGTPRVVQTWARKPA